VRRQLVYCIFCIIAHIEVQIDPDSVDRYYRRIDAHCSIVVLHDQRYYLWTPELVRSQLQYRVADKSLARPTSRCILFDG